MLHQFYDFVLGMVFGFFLAVPPGPMNALIAAEATRSPIHGTSVGLGAMSADGILMIITYFFSRILGHYVYYLYFVGFAVMMYLAASILRSTFSPRNTSGNRSPFLNYFMGVSMGLTNPYQVFWWLTAGLSFISIFGISSIIGLFLAILIWVFVFPYAVHVGKVYGGSRVDFAIKLISALGIIAFAVYIIIRALLYFM
ncbi:MAG: LysE family translocator [Vulcanisaeta sp.]|jgi:threonine/homoserine/homoserine lactone efflux protein|uniref:Lysine exporter protein (LYSE/YGGA) n=1 Tax=Vulcanisaeta moutnovskia (strain 768-28) TaxID=985053 RepID=F0QY44_VULM7|nr:LysE family transporter [Vulcanisaeta moutnovskia]ADY02530.1 Lysine exporter protein (LYSE/YGGA) [Vulcanisaeta moutnovskia 768-28]